MYSGEGSDKGKHKARKLCQRLKGDYNLNGMVKEDLIDSI